MDASSGSVPAHIKTHGNNGIDGHVKNCKKNPHNAVKSDKVVAFVVKDEMPFRVVEGARFVEMMKEAQPRFKIPNKKKIASLVWDLYALEMAKIKSVIGDQRVSITIDTWISIQNINYMVITAQFLDNDWKLHKRIINFTKITSHKGDAIGKVLETCLSDWEIDKVFTITVDNASTNDKAMEYMGKRLKEMGTLLFDGKYLHLRCCCHIINLIVKSGLKFPNESVESIRNCVKYIHSSGARLDQFRECAILLKMDKMSTVPMDVPTRWNSTYIYNAFCRWFREEKESGASYGKRLEEGTSLCEFSQEIAKDIFSIPSSTVASENAFSLGRRVVDPFRASLHPKMVEALVCTSDWLRGEEINLYKEPTEDEFNFYKDCEEVVTSKYPHCLIMDAPDYQIKADIEEYEYHQH
ncbi:hypothetical protein ZIOFF_007398 [Zingiber officinale]|uniref:HAT C-terminal dimerisation domain-containing protein n=1 Tax=Zingiber officinale TaxID=94328 RepID=A0A8J5HQ52_ZINOF|nr:hypothetical protein ZIOFF_007398 [Zingiber officinale]